MGKRIKVNIDIEEIECFEGWDDSRRACDYDSPFPNLFRIEVRKLQRKAKMTELQANVFEWYVADGLSISSIADGMDMSRTAVRKHLKAACRKAIGIKGCGMLTVLIEQLGGNAVISENGSNWYQALSRMLGKPESDIKRN